MKTKQIITIICMNPLTQCYHKIRQKNAAQVGMARNITGTTDTNIIMACLQALVNNLLVW